MDYSQIELKQAIDAYTYISEQRDNAYINLMQQINTRVATSLKDDMGSQFIKNCGRDLAGEIVRNYFDTADYCITVDQLARRILRFNYDNEYDPLASNGGVGELQKSIYNYNEISSQELNKLSSSLDYGQKQLFVQERATDSLDAKGKKGYREQQYNVNGELFDELTGKKETQTTVHKNGKVIHKSDLHADHIQSRESARYNSEYITHDGVEVLKEFWNSSDNMQMMHSSANTSKGDVRVCETNGTVIYSSGSEWRSMTDELDFEGNPTGNKIAKDGYIVKDITHKATAEQLTEATVRQWEKGDLNSPKIQKLIDQGYLRKDKNGNISVPKSVRNALEHNIRHSQNAESVVVLKNTDYSKVVQTASKNTVSSIGKIIAGQIIYYAAPPLVYEIRLLLANKAAKLDDVLDKLGKASIRIGNYVLSRIKDIFKNVVFNSLKKFIKSFMDILIGLVKASIKKLLKMTKNLSLATIDAVRIIADKNASVEEKADSVFNLFGITVTSCVIEVLFEILAKTLYIPEPFDDIIFGPLQILATIVCTNLTMLILQKADLFDVRFGLKMNAIKKIFAEERKNHIEHMQKIENRAYAQIEEIIQSAKNEARIIYTELQQINPRTQSVHGQLEKINHMFTIEINLDDEWLRFIGYESTVLASS